MYVYTHICIYVSTYVVSTFHICKIYIYIYIYIYIDICRETTPDVACNWLDKDPAAPNSERSPRSGGGSHPSLLVPRLGGGQKHVQPLAATLSDHDPPFCGAP